MNKFVGFLAIAVILASISVTAEAILTLTREPEATATYARREQDLPASATAEFAVYVDNVYTAGFSTYDEAVAFAGQNEKAAVRRGVDSEWMWDNHPPYNVYTGENRYEEFETFAEAAAYARARERSFIYYRKDHNLIWTNAEEPKDASRIEGVPHVSQLPELPSGCEVTSLAMLLRFYGEEADKMTLAEQVAKDPAVYEVKNGVVHWGDPNAGFVGDMTRRTQSAYAVYHKPVHELLSLYFPHSALDLTGCEFSDIKRFVSGGGPVWVIVNTKYKKLPASDFVTWESASGTVRATYSVHAVVVTGYDGENVYFNDPLGRASSAPVQGFTDAWEQLGRQAVAVSR